MSCNWLISLTDFASQKKKFDRFLSSVARNLRGTFRESFGPSKAGQDYPFSGKSVTYTHTPSWLDFIKWMNYHQTVWKTQSRVSTWWRITRFLHGKDDDQRDWYKGLYK